MVRIAWKNGTSQLLHFAFVAEEFVHGSDEFWGRGADV
jgi:hypothetical protein